MKRFVEVYTKYPYFIENGNKDIKIKIKKTKNKTDYSLDLNDAIILDNNGKNYILTFCVIDYGGGGPFDYVEESSFIFKVNDWQAEVLKGLVGHLGSGTSYGQKSKNKTFEKLKNSLCQFGNTDELLKKMDIDDKTFYSDVFVFLNEF